MVGAPRPIVATRQPAQNNAQAGQLNLIECVREPAFCAAGRVAHRCRYGRIGGGRVGYWDVALWKISTGL